MNLLDVDHDHDDSYSISNSRNKMIHSLSCLMISLS